MAVMVIAVMDCFYCELYVIIFKLWDYVIIGRNNSWVLYFRS